MIQSIKNFFKNTYISYLTFRTEQLYQSGDYTGAKKTCSAILNLLPNDIDTLSKRVDIWLGLGNHANAEEDLNTILSIDPNHTQALLKLAEVKIAQDKTKEGLIDYKTLAYQTSDIKLLKNISTIQRDKGDHHNAIETLSKIIILSSETMKPLYLTALFLRGESYKKIGKFEQAIDDLSNYINALSYYDTSKISAIKSRAKCYELQGKFSALIDDLELLIKHTDDKDYYTNERSAFLCLLKNDYEKAEQFFTVVSNVKASRFSYRAFCRIMQKNFEGARNDLILLQTKQRNEFIVNIALALCNYAEDKKYDLEPILNAWNYFRSQLLTGNKIFNYIEIVLVGEIILLGRDMVEINFQLQSLKNLTHTQLDFLSKVMYENFVKFQNKKIFELPGYKKYALGLSLFDELNNMSFTDIKIFYNNQEEASELDNVTDRPKP